MMMIRKFLLPAVLAAALGGCSTFNSVTGQTDNTVLPGQREDAIPGRSQFPDQPDPVVSQSADGAQQPPESTAPEAEQGCQPDDPSCQPASSGDVFSDPQ